MAFYCTTGVHKSCLKTQKEDGNVMKEKRPMAGDVQQMTDTRLNGWNPDTIPWHNSQTLSVHDRLDELKIYIKLDSYNMN